MLWFETLNHISRKVALYFAFLNHLAFVLFFPSVVAVGVYWYNSTINEKIPYPDRNVTAAYDPQSINSSLLHNHTSVKPFIVSLDPKDYRQVYYDDESLVWYAFFVALWATCKYLKQRPQILFFSAFIHLTRYI